VFTLLNLPLHKKPPPTSCSKIKKAAGGFWDCHDLEEYLNHGNLLYSEIKEKFIT
jgi:hypothetical protein